MKLKKLFLFTLGFVISSSSMAYADQSYLQPESSTRDYTLFETDDERESYQEHGFSRGDIKNLHEAKYDSKNENTLSGVITKVMRVRFPNKDCYSILVIRNSDREVLASVAPIWFIDENNMKLNEGDRIKIKGSFIRNNGRQIVVVSEVFRNGKSLRVRDSSGNPLWGKPKTQQTDIEDDDDIFDY